MGMALPPWLQSCAFHGRQLLGLLKRVVFPKPLTKDAATRLHLGCGPIDSPGFTNIDGVDRAHVHFVQSITDLSRFPSSSVDFVYTSHTLEHFPRAQTQAILEEWHRVLAPGGKLCVSVPDFDRILEMYDTNGKDLCGVLDPLFGGQDYPFNFHHTVFNRDSLTQAFLQAGFSKVHPWTHGSDALHSLPDWSGRSVNVNGKLIPISLNLEAIK